MWVELIKLIFTALVTVCTALATYHRYLMKEIDKKVNKCDCELQQKILREKRDKIELIIEERTKTIFKKQDEIQKLLESLIDHVMKK